MEVVVSGGLTPTGIIHREPCAMPYAWDREECYMLKKTGPSAMALMKNSLGGYFFYF